MSIFEDAFFTSPRNYQEARRAEDLKNLGKVYQNTPLEDIAGSSSAVDTARFYLPHNLAESDLFNSAIRQLDYLPINREGNRGISEKIRDTVGKIPLGGFHPDERNARDQFLQDRPEVAQTYTRPYPKGQAPSAGARAQQIGGALAADVMSDGLRNIWWFLNAPQALTQLTLLEGLHREQVGMENPGTNASIGDEELAARLKQVNPTHDSLLKNRNIRLAATVPAIIAMSTGIGNIGRPAGYKAVLPSESDPRRTDSPIGELVSRYFLGRTGRLLPYDEFSKERPDVSESEYRRYKAYQFDRKTDLNPFDDGTFNILGALKGTATGIHGPEINFMGKSMPAATAILPTLAAAAGARYGFRRGARNIARAKGPLEVQNLANEKIKAMKKEQDDLKYAKPDTPEMARRIAEPTRIEDLRQEMQREKIVKETAAREGQKEMLWEILKYGGGAAAVGGITGQGLESIRRTMGTEDV